VIGKKMKQHSQIENRRSTFPLAHLFLNERKYTKSFPLSEFTLSAWPSSAAETAQQSPQRPRRIEFFSLLKSVKKIPAQKEYLIFLNGKNYSGPLCEN